MEYNKEQLQFVDIVNRKRILIIFIVFFIILSYISIRLFKLQIIDHKKLSAEATAQRNYRVSVDSLRGNIFDKNGIPLTGSNYKSYIIVFPHAIHDKYKAASILQDAVKISFDEILDKLNTANQPLEFAIEDVNSLGIAEYSPWYVIVDKRERYKGNQIASHLIGYVNEIDGRLVGMAGIERNYEDTLKSRQPQRVAFTIDAYQKFVPAGGYRIINPPRADSGTDIHITVDYHLQKVSEQALQSKGCTGALIILDADTGDVLAMASSPSYDFYTNQTLHSANINHVNKGIEQDYDIGHMYNVIISAAAIENGILDENDMKLKEIFDDRVYLSEVLGNLSKSYLHEFTSNLGFGQKVEIGLVEESAGYISNKSAFSAISNEALVKGKAGIKATPIQIADLTLAIANQGQRKKINIIRTIGRKRIIKHQNLERVFLKETANLIKQGMLQEINILDSSLEYSEAMERYGGVSFIVDNNSGGFNSWHTGFYPYDKPKYIITLLIEDTMTTQINGELLYKDIIRSIEKIR